MVGEEGFEPPWLRSQTECLTSRLFPEKLEQQGRFELPMEVLQTSALDRLATAA